MKAVLSITVRLLDLAGSSEKKASWPKFSKCWSGVRLSSKSGLGANYIFADLEPTNTSNLDQVERPRNWFPKSKTPALQCQPRICLTLVDWSDWINIQPFVGGKKMEVRPGSLQTFSTERSSFTSLNLKGDSMGTLEYPKSMRNC